MGFLFVNIRGKGAINMQLKEAMEDLEYLINKVKNVHIGTFNGISKGQEFIFQKAKDKLYEGISIGEFAFIANEVIGSLEDAHSRLEINFSQGDKYIDVQALWLKDGVYVCEDDTHLKKGDKILEIGGRSIDYIFHELKNLIPHENEYIVKAKAFNKYNKMSFLFSDIVLDYLNLIEDEKVLLKIERQKKTFNISCNLKEYECHQESEKWLEYYIHKDSNIGVFKLDQCIFNEEYKLRLRNFFKEIYSNDIKNVVVDLRNNMGGDSRVAYEFLNYLNIEEYKDYRMDERISEEIIDVYKNLFGKDDLQIGYIKAEDRDYIIKSHKNSVTYEKFKGQLYVLTSNTTFSSARSFAVIIKDNSLGTIVGEPTGGKPSSYGNVARFKMPNSKIKLSLSTNKFIRTNENIDEDSLYPDVEVNTTIDNIIKGEDSQIKWIEERGKKFYGN